MYLERLISTIKAIRGHGGLREVAKALGKSEDLWQNLRRSKRGITLNQLLAALEAISVEPQAFFSDVSRFTSAPEPQWFASFEQLRLSQPQEALRLVENQDCPWGNYAKGLLCLNLGHSKEAIRHFLNDTPSPFKTYRNLALAHFELETLSWRYFSDKAAAAAIFSGLSAECLKVDRSAMLMEYDQETESLKLIDSVNTRELTEVDFLSFSQVRVVLLERAGLHAEAKRQCLRLKSDPSVRMYEGHVQRMRGRIFNDKNELEAAIQTFGRHFPKETCLTAIDLAEIDAHSPVLGAACELLRGSGYSILARILEDSFCSARLDRAVSMRTFRGKVVSAWRTHCFGALQAHGLIRLVGSKAQSS